MSVKCIRFYETHILIILDSWRWERKVVPKRRSPTTVLRSVTSQKGDDFGYAAAEAWTRSHLLEFCEYFLYRSYLRSNQKAQNRAELDLVKFGFHCIDIYDSHVHSVDLYTEFGPYRSGNTESTYRGSGTRWRS